MPLPEGYEVSADPDRIDVDYVHRYLSEVSYWAAGIPRDIVARSIANSIPFGVYGPDGAQVGFARVITDRATFAYLADVFIDPGQQRRGLGKALLETIFAHPDLQTLRRFLLVTLDAHALYAQYGFVPLPYPDRTMAIIKADLYRKQ
ncbi:GNAT family N-acetyltransferase [Devosia lacusdianchii]|jgi:GNAT superfamily N-acetyltransferase|uniref:GNAT family N-acetyltransferase n=1 Tax=Devosia lacusdianchii TaxID=2917991 RepID=UPI001F067B17|nr:GNAT family N-acetyltransferase [Devosia sp. JXJ CY 41]